MKSGVLFWGFQNLNFISDCAKRLKKNYNIEVFYIQISNNEKTISLLDIFPEEIIRSECSDLSILYNWIKRIENKNTLIVFDSLFLIVSKNFETEVFYFQKILKEHLNLLILCPKIYYPNDLGFLENKKLSSIFLKTKDFFKNNKLTQEIVLNSNANVFILLTPIYDLMFESILCRSVFRPKKFLFFKLVPRILRTFPSSFVSRENFKLGVVDRISSIVSNLEEKKVQTLSYRSFLDADIIGLHYCVQTMKKNIYRKLKEFYIPVSLERFFNEKKSKENLVIALWFIYLSILEHNDKFSEEKQAAFDLNKMFFSQVQRTAEGDL